MSRSRSDASGDGRRSSDPLRPADHADCAAAAAAATDIVQPALGFVGWLRWGWRQLTSMRTALVLLLLLAIAAVPGSIVPQRSADPNGVTQYFADNPDLAPILDNLQLFDVYTSAWFSAIYILLFVSLIGCVIPRTKHHWKALRGTPPRTPARLRRLDDHRESIVELTPERMPRPPHDAAIELAEAQLKKAGYRVERYDAGATALGLGGARVPARDGQPRLPRGARRRAARGRPRRRLHLHRADASSSRAARFVNTMLDYASFNPGRFVDEEQLTPYSLTLDEFDVTYQPSGTRGAGQAGDFVAHLTTQLAGRGAPDGRRARQPPARDRRRPRLPHGQRLRADDHDPRRRRRRRVRASRCRSCRRTPT